MEPDPSTLRRFLVKKNLREVSRETGVSVDTLKGLKKNTRETINNLKDQEKSILWRTVQKHRIENTTKVLKDFVLGLFLILVELLFMLAIGSFRWVRRRINKFRDEQLRLI